MDFDRHDKTEHYENTDSDQLLLEECIIRFWNAWCILIQIFPCVVEGNIVVDKCTEPQEFYYIRTVELALEFPPRLPFNSSKVLLLVSIALGLHG